MLKCDLDLQSTESFFTCHRLSLRDTLLSNYFKIFYEPNNMQTHRSTQTFRQAHTFRLQYTHLRGAWKCKQKWQKNIHHNAVHCTYCYDQLSELNTNWTECFICSCGHGIQAIIQTHKSVNKWRIRMFRPTDMDPRIKIHFINETTKD